MFDNAKTYIKFIDAAIDAALKEKPHDVAKSLAETAMDGLRVVFPRPTSEGTPRGRSAAIDGNQALSVTLSQIRDHHRMAVELGIFDPLYRQYVQDNGKDMTLSEWREYIAKFAPQINPNDVPASLLDHDANTRLAAFLDGRDEYDSALLKLMLFSLILEMGVASIELCLAAEMGNNTPENGLIH